MVALSEETKSRLWQQAVAYTHNHYYYLEKEHGVFPVTGDMIKCTTDREYARLLRLNRNNGPD